MKASLWYARFAVCPPAVTSANVTATLVILAFNAGYIFAVVTPAVAAETSSILHI